MNYELLASIKQVVFAFPDVVKYLTPETLASLGIDDEVKTEGYYDRALWETVRGFYNNGDGGAFLDRMIGLIRQQLTRAWREGAAAVGFDPDEMDMEDLAELERIIHDESEFIFQLGDDILRAKSNGEDVRNFRQRATMWANRYGDVVNQAKIWFGRKVGTKLKWVLGATEQHCGTCAGLNGLVAYAKEWDQAGIHPQQPPNGVLECGGWQCRCQLVPTTERRTWGILNKLLDMAVARNLGKKYAKYDPNQPRVPAGNPTGGQWTSIIGGEKLTDDQITAIENYANMDYRELNPYLRGEQPKRPAPHIRERAINDTLDNLDSIMEKSIISEDMVVYKGVTRDYFNSLDVGQEIQENGFISSSLLKSKAVEFGGYEDRINSFIVEINVPKGTHGIYLEEIIHSDEYELLIDRGLTLSFTRIRTERITTDYGRIYSAKIITANLKQ